jgi:hypothetical protein
MESHPPLTPQNGALIVGLQGLTGLVVYVSLLSLRTERLHGRMFVRTTTGKLATKWGE